MSGFGSVDQTIRELALDDRDYNNAISLASIYFKVGKKGIERLLELLNSSISINHLERLGEALAGLREDI